jgi:BRCT domain type II-containing protein
MIKERVIIMEKARAKKHRREKAKSAKTTVRKSTRSAGSSASGLQKFVDIVQEATKEVGALAKAAAVKITG